MVEAQARDVAREEAGPRHRRHVVGHIGWLGPGSRGTGRAAGGTQHDPGDYAFVYLNLRMAAGRSAATHKRVGDALLMATKSHFQPVFARRHIGVTLQIDEGNEVFDAKHSNLHPLFAPPTA